MSNLYDRLAPRGVSDHLKKLVVALVDPSKSSGVPTSLFIFERGWLSMNSGAYGVRQQQMEVRVRRRSE
jgi:hypothetical protein